MAAPSGGGRGNVPKLAASILSRVCRASGACTRSSGSGPDAKARKGPCRRETVRMELMLATSDAVSH